MNLLQYLFKKLSIKKSKNAGSIQPPLLIGKSKILSGLRCPALFWHEVYLKDQNQSSSKNDLIQYIELREIYNQKFSDKIIIKEKRLKDAYNATIEALSQNKPISNAVFINKNLFTKIDILNPDGSGGWETIEFKFTPSIKKHFIDGTTYNKYILEKCGIEISKYLLFTIQSKYVWESDSIDFEKYIKSTDVTGKVQKNFEDVKKKIEYLLSLKNNPLPSAGFEGRGCRTPKSCPLKEYCWKELQDGDIFSLRDGSELVQNLYNSGIKYIKNIPTETELTQYQKIQVSTVRSKKTYIDIEKINHFLSGINYPIYFLDFETINPPLPIFKGTRPFQHLPIQYSLHIQKNEADELVHYEYIHNSKEDPRKEIIENLSSLIGTKGSIVCYNDVFEKRCISEAVQYINKHSDWFKNIINNFIDLSIPFRTLMYYHPNQNGLASLKSILPVLTNSDYKDLEISDGQMANRSFLKLKTGKFSAGEKDEIMNSLLKYCKMDTYALFLVLNALKLLVKEK